MLSKLSIVNVTLPLFSPWQTTLFGITEDVNVDAGAMAESADFT